MTRKLLRLAVLIALGATLGAGARAQSFPFQDTFVTYPPGSTGAPSWSVLDGMWQVADNALTGPVVARYNARPPHRYTIALTVAPASDGRIDAEVCFDMPKADKATPSDTATLTTGPNGARMISVGPEGPSAPPKAATPSPSPSSDTSPATWRVVVDADAGRYAVFLGDALKAQEPAEYDSGLVAIRLGDGVRLKNVEMRAPTPDELSAVRVTTLFNDPRDIAPGDGDSIFVLHRGSPAVLMVTPDGEVTRSFGRRMPGGIPDPVAMVRGLHGEVFVLNRFPGEVVVYDRNGGIRYRFGLGRLNEPTDLAIVPDGTVYVADPGGRRILVFGADGRFKSDAVWTDDALHNEMQAPRLLSTDAVGNLIVSFNHSHSVIARPEADRTRLTKIGDVPASVADVAAGDGNAWSLSEGAVQSWPHTAAGAAAFRATALGGLDPDGRLAVVNGNVWVLDRAHSRLVRVPLDLKDTTPDVTFQNIAQSSALVRWTSEEPATVARVHILRGDSWDTETQRDQKPTRQHQVPVDRLLPGRTYRYAVSPIVATVPPTDWSAEFTFQTSGAPEPTSASPAAPASNTSPASKASPAAPEGGTEGGTGVYGGIKKK